MLVKVSKDYTSNSTTGSRWHRSELTWQTATSFQQRLLRKPNSFLISSVCQQEGEVIKSNLKNEKFSILFLNTHSTW